MKKIVIFGMLMFALLTFSGVLSAQTPNVPEGFTALFNGRDLSGWVGIQRDMNPYVLDKMPAEERQAKEKVWNEEFKKEWRVENGELVNNGNGPYATTAKEYKNFELLIEYKTVPLADSGIYLRMTPQVQIWDYTKEGGKWNLGADKGSGGLWNNKKNAANPLIFADKPFGQWNSFRIVLVDDVCNIWLNGKQVVKDTPLENYWNRSIKLREKAPIQLQTHGGEIRWRNIFIKELP